ncbi:unnamed protein product [Soboliphyme baturini]|uniref:G_PROTEIN_RECEP_F1_2 domain-containing protein n=1 Tax=Soboliphyme baturini TaxID=241478 RepID=A0A183I945_9BILA|nr:unnamed protein product [Soboliphyme baturini]
MTTGQCFSQGIHIYFFETGFLSLSYHLLLISIDRAAIVNLYSWSRVFNATLTVRMIVLINVTTTVDFCAVIALRLACGHQLTTMSAKCYHDDVVGVSHFAYHLYTTLVVSFLIVFVYIGAVVTMWMKRYNVGVDQSRRQREEAVTKRVSVLIVPIFLFHIIPFTLYAVVDEAMPYFQITAIYIWLLGCFNSTLNNFVYAFLHPELRKILYRIVLCCSNRRIQVSSLNPAGFHTEHILRRSSDRPRVHAIQHLI